MNSFHVAFHFILQNSSQPLSVTLTVDSPNQFLSGGSYTQQVMPYLTQATPPLVSVSLTETQFYVQSASPGAAAGMQGLELVTYVSAEGDSLVINVAMNGDVSGGYSFLGGTGGAGVLKPGLNTIPFPSSL